MRSPTVLSAIVAIAMTSISAQAADLPTVATEPAQAPVVYNPAYNAWLAGPWTGFYVGGNLGYGWASAAGNYTLTGNAFAAGNLATSPISLNGVNGGLQAGYNWQTGMLLLGIEGDFQAADPNQTLTSSCGAGCSVTETAKLSWFGTVRGRAGIAIKDVLLYGTGGLNWTYGTNNFTGTLNGTTGNLANFTFNSLGWTAGGGVEWMFYWGWTAKIEYLYLKNNNSSSSVSVPAGLGGGTLTNTVSASNQIVRVGINYHFLDPAWRAPR